MGVHAYFTRTGRLISLGNFSHESHAFSFHEQRDFLQICWVPIYVLTLFEILITCYYEVISDRNRGILDNISPSGKQGVNASSQPLLVLTDFNSDVVLSIFTWCI